MKHPKPWTVKRYEMHTRLYYIEDANGEIVQDDFLGDETALEIVAAVNSRERLVEALKLADGLVKHINQTCTNDSVLAGITYSASIGIEQALSEGSEP